MRWMPLLIYLVLFAGKVTKSFKVGKEWLIIMSICSKNLNKYHIKMVILQ